MTTPFMRSPPGEERPGSEDTVHSIPSGEVHTAASVPSPPVSLPPATRPGPAATTDFSTWLSRSRNVDSATRDHCSCAPSKRHTAASLSPCRESLPTAIRSRPNVATFHISWSPGPVPDAGRVRDQLVPSKRHTAASRPSPRESSQPIAISPLGTRMIRLISWLPGHPKAPTPSRSRYQLRPGGHLHTAPSSSSAGPVTVPTATNPRPSYSMAAMVCVPGPAPEGMNARSQVTPSEDTHTAASESMLPSYPTATTFDAAETARFMVWSSAPSRRCPGSGTRIQENPAGKGVGVDSGDRVPVGPGEGEVAADGSPVGCPPAPGAGPRPHRTTALTTAPATIATATPNNSLRGPRRATGASGSARGVRSSSGTAAARAGSGTPSASAAAAANSAQVGKRPSRGFDIARRSTSSTAGGAPGRRRATAGGVSWRWAYITPTWSSRGNGTRPVRHWNSTQASEY